jgi:type IV pilus assembly protein PilW
MKQPSHKQIYLQTGFQRGLSLIELMISITIGLLILVSLSTLFINQSKTRVELDKSNRMIDNGRYALELLSGNLRLAGFYDNYASIGTPAMLYDPCDTASLTDSTKNLDILNLPVQGYNAATATSLVIGPPCSLTYMTGSNLTLKAGSDILVVRRASTTIAANAANGTTYLQVSMCQNDIAAPPNNYQIVTAPAVAPASFITMHKKDCAAAADLRPFLVQVYFVSPDNNPGDGIPTLKRRELTAPGGVPVFVTTPLVEGIEYMQVDYGVDDSGDGATDRYTDCSACTLADWSNVVAVRINIVARNQEVTKDWSDSKTYSLGLAGNYTPTGTDLNFKRHAYTQLVRLVNPAGRRETP